MRIFAGEAFEPKASLDVDGRSYPIIIQQARGHTATARLRNGIVMVRLPRSARAKERSKAFDSLVARIEGSIRKGEIGERELMLGDGQQLSVMGTNYTIRIDEAEYKKACARAKMADGPAILIRVPLGADAGTRSKLISVAVKRLLSKSALPEVWSRVSYINNTYYGFDVRSVSINRINLTRWGSCSPREGKINLDLRLIFAPPGVIDSVIVHELCHMKVSRHNEKFWGLVHRAMPDYKEKRRWLNENGYALGRSSMPKPQPHFS